MDAATVPLYGPGSSFNKNNKDGAERRVVVCSAYMPYDSEEPPPSKELEELVHYCKSENLYLVMGCDSKAHHTAWGSTNCNDTGVALVEFLNTMNLEILNQDNDPTFCSGNRLEVIEITLGSFGLLGRVKSWEVSSEPSVRPDIFCSLYRDPNIKSGTPGVQNGNHFGRP